MDLELLSEWFDQEKNWIHWIFGFIALSQWFNQEKLDFMGYPNQNLWCQCSARPCLCVCLWQLLGMQADMITQPLARVLDTKTKPPPNKKKQNRNVTIFRHIIFSSFSDTIFRINPCGLTLRHIQNRKQPPPVLPTHWLSVTMVAASTMSDKGSPIAWQ